MDGIRCLESVVSTNVGVGHCSSLSTRETCPRPLWASTMKNIPHRENDARIIDVPA
jgi:hypothetical protein